MNQRETLKLIAVIKALCPSQKFEQATPDAWAMVLGDIPLDSAHAAIQTIYRTQGDDIQWTRTIEADDIIRQVRRDRTRHIETNASCHICGRGEYACQIAQENALRIGNDVHSRYPGRPWVNVDTHDFTPHRSEPPLRVVQ